MSTRAASLSIQSEFPVRVVQIKLKEPAPSANDRESNGISRDEKNLASRGRNSRRLGGCLTTTDFRGKVRHNS